MRLLFLPFSITPFGSPDLIWYRAARLALTKGHTVWLSAYDWGQDNPDQYDALRRLGAQIDYRSRGISSENLWLRQLQRVGHKLRRDFTAYWRRLAALSRPDIIIINDPGVCHFLSAPGLYEWLITSEIPVVTISQYNDESGGFRPDLYTRARAIYSKLSASIFVSHRNLDVARRQLCLPLDRALVLDNPPAFEDLSVLPFPGGGAAKMAMVARLECKVKGQDVVLDILSRSEWQDRDWSLTVAGNGPDANYLQDLARYYGMEDRVRFIGHCGDVRSLWADHALLLMCSLGEGKPLALTEAMVCGRPAVVTDVGGNAELVEDGMTGYVAESATFKSFARAMERAWEQRFLWEKMGALAHAIVASRLALPPERQLLNLIETMPNSESVCMSITDNNKKAGMPNPRAFITNGSK